MSDSRELVLCDETFNGRCIRHGTHFGVSEVAVQPEEVTDGYHSFADLYDHRRALTAVLAAAAGAMGDAWRSKAHHPDGDPMFDGYFIVGIQLPTGTTTYRYNTITYHYKLEHWDDFAAVPEIEHAPVWDGATPADTVTRLLETARLAAADED